VGRALLYAAIVTAAAAVPLVLWPSTSALIGDTYGRAYRPFELLGLTGSVAILLIAGLELRTRRRRTLADVLPVVLPVLVAFVFLGLVVEYSRKSWDYRCYEGAAKALVAGSDPYEGTAYLYPPLLAQLLAGAYQLTAWIQAAVGRAGAGAPDSTWFVVFYLYQCLQLLAVSLVFPPPSTGSHAAGGRAIPGAGPCRRPGPVQSPALCARSDTTRSISTWSADPSRHPRHGLQALPERPPGSRSERTSSSIQRWSPFPC